MPINRTVPNAIPAEYGLNSPRCFRNSAHFVQKVGRNGHQRRPRKSFTCEEKMITAMPLVKPTTTGWGTNLIIVPKRSSPNENNTRHECCENQSIDTVFRHDAVNDHDEGAGWTANLDPAPTEQ